MASPQMRACGFGAGCCMTEVWLRPIASYSFSSIQMCCSQAAGSGSLQFSECTHKHGQRPRGFFRNLDVPPSPTSLPWTHLRFQTWKRRSASWAGRCCSRCQFSAVWWWPAWLCCGWSLSQGSPGLDCRQSQQMGASWPPRAEKKEWKLLNIQKRLSWQKTLSLYKLSLLHIKINATDCTQGSS